MAVLSHAELPCWTSRALRFALRPGKGAAFRSFSQCLGSYLGCDLDPGLRLRSATMTSVLAAGACSRATMQPHTSRHQPRPITMVPRLALVRPLGLRKTLPPCQGKTLNTEYNVDPSAYDADKDLILEELDMADPNAVVGDIMTAKNLRSTQPGSSLRSADSKLDKVTGLPVVDENDVVVGVISKKDMNRLRKQGVSFDLPVSQFMSTPPLVVTNESRVGEAAAIMLEKKIHRLCVVDEEGKLLGVVSRTDIFNPLVQSRVNTYDALSFLGADGGSQLQAAIQKSIDLDIEERQEEQEHWEVKYLYDGDCSMCMALVAMLKRQDDGRGLISFVNIASMAYNPRENEGIEYEEAMETIHAIQRDGTILTGTDALKALYDTVGLGWAARLGSLPILGELVDALYNLLSKLRLPMGKGLDTILALRRMKLTSEGVEHCVDDEEECQAEW